MKPSRLHCTVTFFKDKRKCLPLLNAMTYRPHFVVKGSSDYLGICFINGEVIAFDKPTLCIAVPLYDTVNYSPLSQSVAFWIMEGGKAVGEGVVEMVDR